MLADNTAGQPTSGQPSGGLPVSPEVEEMLMRKVLFCAAMVLGIGLGSAGAAEPPAGRPMPGHAMEGKPADAKGMHATCGQMTASMAGLPAKMGEGASAVADVLDAHVALLGKDKDSATEAKAMRAIAKQYRQVAADYAKASDEMKKAANWPNAPHDMAKMRSDPKLSAATQKLIDVNKEIIAMLQKAVADMEQHQKAAPAK